MRMRMRMRMKKMNEIAADKRNASYSRTKSLEIECNNLISRVKYSIDRWKVGRVGFKDQLLNLWWLQLFISFSSDSFILRFWVGRIRFSFRFRFYPPSGIRHPFRFAA